MNTRIKPVCMLVVVLAVGFAPAFIQAQNPGPPSGNGITPVFVAGNPNCASLGYKHGFKPQPEPPPNGAYPFPSDLANAATIANNDGKFFDWTSTLGVDAVIVKGGPNASVFVYAPPAEAFSDTGLHPPVNPNNNEIYDISHIDFCYDYEVGVEKDAEPSFTRTWSWSLEKAADQTEIILAEGQPDAPPVNYTVTVDATSADSDWAVDGTIWIHNPSPFDNATIEAVDDVFEGDVAAVDCGVGLPHVLGPGEDLHCTYHLDLDGPVDGTNTATVTTSGAVGGGEGTAEVAFSEATITGVDECVDVTDSKTPPLGTVCADDLGTNNVYYYQIGISPSDLGIGCGPEFETNTAELINTACFETGNTGVRGCNEWPVTVTIACDGSGCTLTQGYWKTHSREGPAPYDDNWQNLGPDEEDTPFFLSGQTYYEVLQTAPQGNAYYILAHQYIAAQLNSLNGASVPPSVQDALNDATTKLSASTPEAIAALKGKSGNAVRQMWINLAGILGSFNEGTIGPGHCSDPAALRLVEAPAGLQTLDLEAEIDAATARAGEVPTGVSVSSYPNPFNPTTTLRIDLTEAAYLRVTVYDVLGRLVSRLADGPREAGSHSITWNAGGLPSGMYLYVVEADSFKRTGNLVLIK